MKTSRTAYILCLAITSVGLLWSQSSYTAAVRGVVTDATGAAVSGAKVTLTESERNVAHVVMADNEGRYAVTALPPGKYSLNVESAGFKRYTQTNISLVVQQQATFDVAL